MYNTNEIYHHGVQGQKWGKRNGPPYPLNAEGKAELRQQKKEQRAQIKVEKKNVTFKNYTDQDKHRLVRNAAIATVIGGPILGVAVGLITDDQIRKGKAAANLGIDFKSQEFSSAVNKGEAILNNSSQDKSSNVNKEQYMKIRNSFSKDENKDKWEYYMDIVNDPSKTKVQKDKAAEYAQKIVDVDKRNKNYKSPYKEQYSITFLEAIQNKEILDLNDTKSIDTEYAKYKQNPEKYFTEDVKKLKDV